MSLPSTLWHAVSANVRSRAPAPALLSPTQGVNWSYEELQAKARGLSQGLSEDRRIQRGDVVATDLPNVAEGLLLHLACARLGAAVATAKNPDILKKIPNVKLAVVSGDNWLSQESFSVPNIVAGGTEMNQMIDLDITREDELDNDTFVDQPLGYFGSSNAYLHSSAIQQGLAMKEYLEMTSDDRVCVSITLYHPFGIGSACASTILAGGAMVLPAVGGLQGCGVPSQRAEVTLDTLVSQECSLLFADTHTLKALEPLDTDSLTGHLRGGVCKTGSGSDILDETVELGAVTLATLGKRE